jgi:flavin reductase ActVB
VNSQEQTVLVDQVTFRAALARLPTAVSVVTTVNAENEPWGVTVGTLCSLSLTPPLVLFCIDRSGASHQVLTSSARFLVHVLGDDQADVAAAFARHGGHGFTPPYATAHGLPTISQALLRLLCTRSSLVEGGDHTIVVGSVEDAEIGLGSPLLYYERGYGSLKRRPECASNHVIAGSAHR